MVVALHDHFTLKAAQASNRVATVPSESQTADDPTTITEGALPDTPVEDTWALKYISVNRIQALMEALDDDNSSFVTVNEINNFTSRRPEGWR